MQYSKEEKEMWLEDWRRSGKEARAYARTNGLVPQTFARWTKTETESEAGFVEVPAAELPLPVQAPVILIEKGDVKIHIPLLTGGNELRAVMAVMGAAL